MNGVFSSICKLLFSSSCIALGALTQGDRRAASAVNFSDFNVDTPYGKTALRSVYDSICKVSCSEEPICIKYVGTVCFDSLVPALSWCSVVFCYLQCSQRSKHVFVTTPSGPAGTVTVVIIIFCNHKSNCYVGNRCRNTCSSFFSLFNGRNVFIRWA